MSPRKIPNPDLVWRDWFSTDAFAVDKRLRRIFRYLPRDPRCKFCNAPFEGIGGRLMKMLYGKQRSVMNPRYCNLCEEVTRQFLGGNEVEMAMLFVDIRGSTALSEVMRPAEFHALINRFYTLTTAIISAEDGLVEKLAGDEVAAFWGAGFAGPHYVERTIKVAQKIARELARQGIPAGTSVHAGVAYFGAVGTAHGLTDITAIGDEVNLAARLASRAAAGEVIVSEPALQAAGWDGSQMESRTLELKGVSLPITVRVMPVEASLVP
jgi:adenylate cyclase